MREITPRIPRLLAALSVALIAAVGVQVSALRGTTVNPATAPEATEAAPMSVLPIAPAAEPAAPADAVTEAPADAVTEVKFVVGHYDCWNAWWGGAQASFDFYIGGTNVGNTPRTNGCSCNTNPAAFTTTDANHLALVGAPACSVFSMRANGSDVYVAYVRAEVTRSTSGTETVCIFDASGGNCGDREACNAVQHSPGRTFSSVLADTDGDSTPDCSDPDIDGDGVANGTDNCPATANADQADANGNGTGEACEPTVAAVPWAGSEAKPHVVYSGGKLVLQAVASTPDGEKVALSSATWDPGDGAGPQPVSFSDSRALELEHVYSGGDFQPYTATITVKDGNGNSYSDTFKVQIVPRTLDAEVNMAIDRGLWYEHKNAQLGQSAGHKTAHWKDGSAYHTIAATASTIQAFEVNGHRETGDPKKNPYVTNVARGLRYLQQNIRRINIGAQAGGDPDGNGNGYGLEAINYNHEPTYVLGQVVDAFIASGTPNAAAVTGTESGRTYKDLVQDMLDTYSWGQHEDGQGGWVYFWNNQDGIDSSSSAWWGVAVQAAKVWGLDAPQWVKDINKDLGIPALQQSFSRDASDYYYGSCAYRAGNGGSPTQTAACMIMMAVDGFERDSPRYAAAEGFLRRNFDGGEMHGNMYAMYNLAKAMRLALDDNGQPSPIVKLGGDLDWYNLDKYPTNPTHGENGFARYLVGYQNPSGEFPSNGWVSTTLSTAWGVLILSPALFEVGPTAVCSTDSSIVCKAGAVGGCNTTGTNPYATVNFSASESTAGDNAIASYSWDFMDGSTASGTTASHSFSSVATFNVKLTVADTKGITSSVTCPVQVVETALPPIADPGGPYAACPAGKIVLDGSASSGRGANIVSYEWDWTAPNNFTPPDSTNATPGDLTAYFQGLGPGTYDVALRVKDDSASQFSTTSFTTVTIKSRDDASCPKDQDGDGHDDPVDNCPAVANANQTDTDGDGQGDACDTDDDNDGVDDGADNCSLTANADQANNDGDAQGDVCDPDDDNDTITDGADNCSLTANTDQANNDGDAQGDVCDTDDDNDGVDDGGDNCQFKSNADQADNDRDGQGDACDPDDDNDGFPDTTDACQFIPGVASAQGCPDADGDTVQDAKDNCVTTPNTDQANNDGDAQGDACDPDDDNDGLPDGIDPRPFIPNVAPSCAAAGPSISQLWPPNHRLEPVTLLGATDADGDALTIKVDSIWQDEPTNTQGDGNTPIDGYGVGSATAQVRAERSGSPRVPGDGRVYHITFTVTEAHLLQGTCSATVKVGVPHDQGQRRVPVDGGPLYKSTGGQ